MIDAEDRILVISAHHDDETLGLGGTLAKALDRGASVTVGIATDGASAQYNGESDAVEKRMRHCLAALNVLGDINLVSGPFPDMRLDSVAHIEVNAWIENLVREVAPTTVFTHHASDVNKDHQVLFESTLVACRPYGSPSLENFLTYYTPSSTEWGGTHAHRTMPINTFVDITGYIEKKIAAFCCYEDELRPFPHPRSAEAIAATAKHFGSTCGFEAAEPFNLIRHLISQ